MIIDIRYLTESFDEKHNNIYYQALKGVLLYFFEMLPYQGYNNIDSLFWDDLTGCTRADVQIWRERDEILNKLLNDEFKTGVIDDINAFLNKYDLTEVFYNDAY